MKFSLITVAASVISIVNALYSSSSDPVSDPVSDPASNPARYPPSYKTPPKTPANSDDFDSDMINQSTVSIKDLQTGGSGCPRGTAEKQFADDRKSFIVIMDSFTVAAGPMYENDYDDRKNCQISLVMTVPQGFQYTIVSTNYRGYLNLGEDVIANYGAEYWFTGGDGTTWISKNQFVGPCKDDYQYSNDRMIGTISWSKCGKDQIFNINAELSVDTSASQGQSGEITTDSVDGKLQYFYGVQWRKCQMEN